MVMLWGFLVLVGFFLLGEALRVLVGLPVSGGVLGMVMVTLKLMLRGRITNELAAASQGLISVLVVLITPGVVGVFFIADQFAGHWGAVVVALVIGTLLSVFTTLLLMKKLTGGQAGGNRNG
ncbi:MULTISPECIES: CidA/LrgA family protein [unclassified Marinobacter]|jgi:Putative effector of murein hydrolase LrgA|uniref:CidA/LrgA family protein n=1 Tax=unclassified Marinobacter TaxID=83889 RepID=UPI000718B019|nr:MULTISPECIES: CidA/LrgA family protein [unclassified Marinobacter]AMQ89627.1 murein hydrolase transporter LrgA [Marinobacter sp. LQ44]MDX5329011.1 CidA/LrgA family protein [Marinobacter sp.]MDX5337195.1 CidA/LrgA family protein [Marinobacter sp.]MDX5388471.1 CidA/LrgA family protein [Marinobacter sp.]MDX5473682.1 CidA/LrgA family protein [Marinobacter sp.]